MGQDPSRERPSPEWEGFRALANEVSLGAKGEGRGRRGGGSPLE
jgi:hypothetical protein